jgi:hypothetical protein
MKMKIALVAVPITLALLVPTTVGLIAKSRINDMFEHLRKRGIAIEESSYEFGWRSSKVSHSVDLELADGEVLNIGLTTEMSHGPYREGATGNWLLFSSDVEVFVNTAPLYPVHVAPVVRTKIEMDRSGFMLVDMPPLEWTLNEGDYVYFKGMVGGMEIGPNIPDETIRYNLKGLSVDTRGYVMDLKNLESTLRIETSAAGLSLGSEVASIERVSLHDVSNAQRYSATGVEFVGEASADNGILGGSAKFLIDEVKVDKGVYGPVEFAFNIDGFIEEAVAKANDAIAGILEEQTEKKTSADKRNAKITKYMGNRGWMIFAGNPRIEYRLNNLETDYGSFSGSFDMSISNLQHKDFRRPKDVFNKIQTSLQLKVPKAFWYEQISSNSREIISGLNKLPVPITNVTKKGVSFQQKITELTSQALRNKIIQEDGESYITRITAENGKIDINGKDYNIPFFK